MNKSLSLFALLALSGGCVSSVTTLPYRPSGENHGTVYALPLTRLKASVTYTIRQSVAWQNGSPVETNSFIYISKPVQLETVIVPDPTNRFVLSGDKLTKDSRLDATFKFAVDDNQLLTAVSSDVTDKTPEAIGSFVASGISIAKIAMAAGQATNRPALLAAVEQRLVAIDGEMAALVADSSITQSTNRTDKLAALVTEQGALLAVITNYHQLNTVKTDDRDVIYSEILDVSDMKPKANHWFKTVRAPGNRLGKKINDNDVPAITIDLYLTAAQHTNAVATYPLGVKGANLILYREVNPVRTTVTVAPDNIVVFDGPLPFVQAGPINAVEARSKAFGKRTTTIVFSATTGSIKEYGVTSTSSLQGVAGALDTTSSKVLTGITDIQTAQSTADAAKKAAQAAAAAAKKTPEQIQTDQLTQQTALLEAQAALIKAQQALDALKAGNP